MSTAVRFSGSLRITVTLCDDDTYTASVRDDEYDFGTLTGLRIPPYWRARIALDSAEAFDIAAEAALGFAAYEHEGVYACAEERNAGKGDGAFAVRR